MALIRHGSLDDFSARVDTPALKDRPILRNLRTFADLREMTRAVKQASLVFDVSGEPRGLALKSLKLTKGFEGFLGNLFNATNEVYFLAWSWDLSGAPVVEYPGVGAKASNCIIPLKVGQVREFIGAGVLLFPARQVAAGLATRIMLWESDQGSRDFGEAMSKVANTIKASELNNLLSLVSLAAGATVASVTLIKDAAIELAAAVGKILQMNTDDYVDFYEGYYPTTGVWTSGDEQYQGYASEISLTRLV